ncbi:hypothetical protein GOP47_0030423 [Adiantum capillus-veneris]|nr:hypothetical protein GOP47_0030423 [Adiantum capillus-veneris]
MWSKQEINEFLDDFEPYRDEYQAMDVNDKASALKLYDRLGGVARYVLLRKKSSEGLMRVKLAVAKFAMDVDQAMQILAGGFVPDVSDPVVHIFCKQGDYENQVFDFASKHVKKVIVEQVQLASDVRIMALLKSAVYDKSIGSLWGCCFEVLVHRVLAHGGQVCVKKVTESVSGPIQNVTIEPHQVVMLDDIGKLKQIVARGIYVKPEDLNFPVADSFMGENIIIEVFKGLSGKQWV